MTGKLRARLPALAHPDVFSDASHTIMTAERNALLTYDPATRSGFVYCIGSGVWCIWAPVDFLQFAIFARASGYTINEGEDARRWMQACGGDSQAPVPAMIEQETRH